MEVWAGCLLCCLCCFQVTEINWNSRCHSRLRKGESDLKFFRFICELPWLDNSVCLVMARLFTESLLHYWHRKAVCLPPHHPWWLILSWTQFYSSLHTSHPPQLYFFIAPDLLYTYSAVRKNLDRNTLSVVLSLYSGILDVKWNIDLGCGTPGPRDRMLADSVASFYVFFWCYWYFIFEADVEIRLLDVW